MLKSQRQVTAKEWTIRSLPTAMPFVFAILSCRHTAASRSEIASEAAAPVMRALPAGSPVAHHVDPKVVAEQETVAGTVRILDLDASRGDELSNCRFAVELGSKDVAHTNCRDDDDPFGGQPQIDLLRDVRTPIPPFDEVLVLQQNGMGNACNGGPLWFLGLNRDGTYRVSKPIDFCGGRPPILNVEHQSIEVILPGGPPNRGTGTIPTERWSYRNGSITRVH